MQGSVIAQGETLWKEDRRLQTTVSFHYTQSASGIFTAQSSCRVSRVTPTLDNRTRCPSRTLPHQQNKPHLILPPPTLTVFGTLTPSTLARLSHPKNSLGFRFRDRALPSCSLKLNTPLFTLCFLKTLRVWRGKWRLERAYLRASAYPLLFCVKACGAKVNIMDGTFLLTADEVLQLVLCRSIAHAEL